MTLHTKTLMFAPPMITGTVVDATLTAFPQTTIYIPENVPSSDIVSVYADVGWSDLITATGGTITEYRLAMRLGSSPYTTITDLADITNTGENLSVISGPFDFIGQFAGYWTGTSQTLDMQIYVDQNTGTTLGVTNVTSIVYVTYESDDQAAVQANTAQIPLVGELGGLPTTQGTSNIELPQLTGVGGMLPEANVVIRDWFIVIEGNTAATAVTDFTVSASIDQGTATAFGLKEMALATSEYLRYIYKPDTVPDPSVGHSFQLWSSLANTLRHACLTLVVTYEYTLAGTTQILVSTEVPVRFTDNAMINLDATASCELSVQEPGPIALQMSALRFDYSTPAPGGTWSVRSQGQVTATRNYAPSGSVMAGCVSLQHPLHVEQNGVPGLVLDRGLTKFNARITSSSGTLATGLTGYILLNYTCGLPSGGRHKAARTRKQFLYMMSPVAQATSLTNQIWVPEPDDYYVIGFALKSYLLSALGTGTFAMQILRHASEDLGYGLKVSPISLISSDAEIGFTWMDVYCNDIFKQFPEDVRADRLDLLNPHTLFSIRAASLKAGFVRSMTYHRNTFTETLDLTNNNAALTSVVKLHCASTDEVLQLHTLAAGTTSLVLTHYDNTEDYYITVRQDDNKVGRSPNFKFT